MLYEFLAQPSVIDLLYDERVKFIVGASTVFLTLTSLVLALVNSFRHTGVGSSRSVRGFLIASVILFAAFATTSVFLSLRPFSFKITRAQAYEMNSHVVGATKDQFIRTIKLDADGKAEHLFSMTIRAVTENIREIEHDFTVTSPDSSEIIGTTQTRIPCTDGRYLDLVPQFFCPGRHVHCLSLDPALSRGESAQMLQSLRFVTGKGAYAMTWEDLSQRPYAEEFTATRISYPSDLISITVIFPKEFRPKLDFAVWEGRCGVPNLEEKYRCEEMGVFRTFRDKHTGETKAVLEVKYPIYSLIYAITWTWDANSNG